MAISTIVIVILISIILIFIGLNLLFSKKKYAIKYGLPTKAETVLLSLLGTTLFFWDVNQNKILDKGLFYRTTWFGDISSYAVANFWAGIIVYASLLITIIILAVRSRKTHFIRDVIAGAIALFGLSFIIGGHVAELAFLANEAFRVPFLYPDLLLVPINFYHIGIGIQLMVGVYFAFTK